MAVSVLAYATANPGDTSDFERKLSRFDPRRIRRLAILGKTEGNADSNDFSRELALLATTRAIERIGGPALLARTTSLFSTGCEGAYTPFGYLFVDAEEARARRRRPGRPGSGLALGVGRSRSLKAREVGTVAHARIVADTVRKAMRDAGVKAAQVGLAIVKTPVMPHVAAVEEGKAEERRITSHDSKAVGGLGAGIALGEVSGRAVTPARIGADHSLHARRAMVFSGSEVDYVEVLLLGNKPGAGGGLAIHSTQIADVLDARSIKRLLVKAGLRLDRFGEVADSERVAAMLLKVGFAPDGRIRGRRTTILTSHIDHDKHLRAAASGILGSMLGTTEFFISADTIHQAPPGGGLCACIVRRRG
ncbi:MAG: ring-opening amidohydrolase [Proteobacteria bacterium]|nr:ring-opening amidohydrolase [Pseudomonadota bacterium]